MYMIYYFPVHTDTNLSVEKIGQQWLTFLDILANSYTTIPEAQEWSILTNPP